VDLAARIIEIRSPDWLRAFNILRKESGKFGEVSLFGTAVHLNFQGDDFENIGDFLRNEDVKIESIRPVVPSLEDVFVTLLKPEKESEIIK
jgi:hypothetical protein